MVADGDAPAARAKWAAARGGGEGACGGGARRSSRRSWSAAAGCGRAGSGAGGRRLRRSTRCDTSPPARPQLSRTPVRPRPPAYRPRRSGWRQRERFVWAGAGETGDARRPSCERDEHGHHPSLLRQCCAWRRHRGDDVSGAAENTQVRTVARMSHPALRLTDIHTSPPSAFSQGVVSIVSMSSCCIPQDSCTPSRMVLYGSVAWKNTLFTSLYCRVFFCVRTLMLLPASQSLLYRTEETRISAKERFSLFAPEHVCRTF